MKVILAAAALSVSIDRFTNRMSLFNVVEQINSPSFPLWMPEISFVVAILRGEGDPQEFTAKTELRLGDKVLVQSNAPISFKNGPIARNILNLRGIPIPAPGELTYRFPLDGEETATILIPVLATPEAATHATSTAAPTAPTSSP